MSWDGLSGFTQGLANSPLGNLPTLLMMKQRMDFDRERAKERDKQFKASFGLQKDQFNWQQEQADQAQSNWEQGFGLEKLRSDRAGEEHDYLMDERRRIAGNREAVTGAYESGGMDAAMDAALKAGDVTMATGLASLDQSRQTFDMAKADRDQKEFGRTFMAGWRPEVPLESNVAWLDRYVKENPEQFQKLASLGPNRVPVGVETMTTPDGETVLVPMIYNKKTKSVGPATVNGTADDGDQIIMLQPDRLMGIAKTWAAGRDPKAPAKGHAPKGFDTKVKDGMIVRTNKDTGEVQTEKLPKTDAEWRTLEQDNVKLLTESGAVTNFDVTKRSRLASNLLWAGSMARRAGYDPFEAHDSAMAVLASSNEISKMVLDAETLEEQDQGRQMLLQHLGIVKPPKAAPAGEKGKEKKDPGLDAERAHIASPDKGASPTFRGAAAKSGALQPLRDANKRARAVQAAKGLADAPF